MYTAKIDLFEGNLVVNGGNKTDSCMTLLPQYIKDFDLKEGDVVRCSYGRLYNYVEVVEKRVRISETREVWRSLKGDQIIPNEDEIKQYEKNWKFLGSIFDMIEQNEKSLTSS